MDFGLTDDQRDIQRTARDLLAERAKPEIVRGHAEAGTVDEALWKELCELGWPGIAISEENGGQGLGRIELSILCEELGRVLAPGPVPADRPRIDPDRALGLRRAARGVAAPSRLRRDHGALGSAVDGTAELVIGAAGADVIVLIDQDGGASLAAGRLGRGHPPRRDRPDQLSRTGLRHR